MYDDKLSGVRVRYVVTEKVSSMINDKYIIQFERSCWCLSHVSVRVATVEAIR